MNSYHNSTGEDLRIKISFSQFDSSLETQKLCKIEMPTENTYMHILELAIFQLKKSKRHLWTPLYNLDIRLRAGGIYKTIGKLHLVLLHVCMYDCII